ncbi:MAG TPA: tungsten formylmethanofuran dehydrogenase, partial [Methylovirgula sp.]
HMYSEILFHDIDVLRQAGQFVTTANEARVRADCVLLIGADITSVWPDMAARLNLKSPARFDDYHEARKVFWIGPNKGEAATVGAKEIAAPRTEIAELLAVLRAQVAGHKVRKDSALARKVAEIAPVLKAARYGVIIWSGESIGRLTIEMIHGLLLDLNKATRFSGLPASSRGNAMGVAQASGWMTGFPMRTGFCRGYPEHDIWRFDASRLVESGETDAVLWVSSYGSEAPKWKKQIPLVALAAPGTRFPYAPKIKIEIGTPGIDHDTVEFAQNLGAIAARDAQKPSEAPQAANVLRLIEKNLNKGDGAC